jgi:hypothetical protein
VGQVAERLRSRLVTGLLSLTCRICGMPPGRGCDPDCPEGEVIQVDRDPPLLVHTGRAADAADSGAVSRRMLLGQFADGEAPAALAGKRTGD